MEEELVPTEETTSEVPAAPLETAGKLIIDVL